MPSRWPIGRAGVLVRLLALAGVLVAAAPAHAQSDLVTFSRGSLIIPEQATFQTGCGSISAYGLVWRILQSNEPGGYNETHPVTVYWVINNSKTSPNRCVPSNRHMPPSPNTGGWSDSRWNDGCDLTITNATEPPVVPVNAAAAPGSDGMYPAGAIPTYATSSSNARPAYSAVTLNDTVSTPAFRSIQYMGGPFVVDAADAPNVLAFLRTATDPAVQQFRNTCSCNTFPNTACHFVQMHQATVQFTAPVSKRINKLPPKIALLDIGSGVSAGILDDYLTNAGLNFTGAAGCPAGTFSGCNTNGGQPGKIYDRFHANADLVSTAANPHGLLNVSDARGRPVYHVFWAPHWVANTSSFSQYVANGDGASDQRANALNNIAWYTDRKGTGVFAECASLESYEGSYESGSLRVAQSTPRTSFHYTNTIDTNGLNNGDNWDGRNCTDPDYLALSSPRPPCVIYPNAADPFSQLGDFRYQSTSGHVHNYRPNSSPASAYQPGVKRLAVSWRNYQNGDFPANASASTDNGWDFFSLRLKDNDINKATIVYLAGHSYTDTVPGNRIVLNTLMNLGADPLGQERALSAPVAYEDPNGTDAAGTKAIVLAPTYEAVAGYPPGVDLYVPAQGSQWVFPYVPGHLRAHSLIGGTALAQGASDLAAATLWDADEKMPLPGQRNLFTYFGGQVVSPSPMGAGRRVRYDTLQVGWVPEKVAGTTLNNSVLTVPNPNCVDVLKMGQGSSRGGPRFDLVSGPDGICDLQEAVQYTALNPGSDYGVTENANNVARLLTDLPVVQQMLQRVRGHCFATSTRLDGSGSPVLEPTDVQCNNPDADNRAHLGGLVHSSPAIVPPSPNIPDDGAPRPTVAYVGGFDGQLHAFFVSGGAGYTGPTGGRGFPNASAHTKFSTDWAQRFQTSTSLPTAGTELWSFLPATQLPWLKSNSARVDSTPVVQDVFADFTGTGLREWHTVLVASMGFTGRDLFALDITNPVKPVLLWHLVGSLFQPGGYPPYSAVALADTTLGGTGYSVKWDQPNALFLARPSADPGRLASGLYDYSDLGGASGLAIGQLRRGLDPVYAVFAATNASGVNGVSRGLEVFAIDVATGQKLWQWEQPYAANWADNTVPPVVSVLPGQEGAARLLVGDMEGRLWELDTGSGMNANVVRGVPGCSAAAPCKLAAFDTRSTSSAPQPLTTNIAIARLPTTPTGELAAYGSATVALVGTAGADWVSGTVPGSLHVLLLDERYRKPVRADGRHLDGTVWAQSPALNSAQQEGLLQEPSPFPLTFAAGAHLHGQITVAGRTAYFQTANGPVNDPMTLSGRTAGATYSMDLGAVSATPATQLGTTSYANFGGVTVFHRNTGTGSKDFIVGQEVSRITNTVITNTSIQGATSPDSQLALENQTGLLYRLLNWMQRTLR